MIVVLLLYDALWSFGSRVWFECLVGWVLGVEVLDFWEKLRWAVYDTYCLGDRLAVCWVVGIACARYSISVEGDPWCEGQAAGHHQSFLGISREAMCLR